MDRLDIIRTLVALAAQKHWKLYELDVKSTFLNGVLEEEVYVDQLDGFVVKGSEDKVYKLHKALYGLKQAPRAWYGEIDTYFAQCGFAKSQTEVTLYTKTRGEAEILIVSIYVDNIVYTGNSQPMLEEFKRDMMVKYEMTDFGLLHHFLGMGVIQTHTITTEKLSKDDGSGPTNEEQYRKIVGSMLYLTATRPDVMYVASLLSRFIHCPTNKHYGTAKRVLGYVKGTLDYDLDGVFTWASVKQNCVALSTAKAKYISASKATARAIWLRFMLEDFGKFQVEATTLQCDNTAAIAITKNPMFHQKKLSILIEGITS
ncbi:unnamed protein product [Prunus armeniaca]